MIVAYTHPTPINIPNETKSNNDSSFVNIIFIDIHPDSLIKFYLLSNNTSELDAGDYGLFLINNKQPITAILLIIAIIKFIVPTLLLNSSISIISLK